MSSYDVASNIRKQRLPPEHHLLGAPHGVAKRGDVELVQPSLDLADLDYHVVQVAGPAASSPC